ncbi:demethylepipodophyllotoxin synthase-like isoform X2 [Argentina anserina]|uniref:demethylepipodophyllotoxin synthase-like isoform X2 n=1 Tax=Argentina anserina TaxID=57926 RepID=UPI002176956B|nr:demethylepipodophyllotoxin synthase-like isoform X2 [Potentilla anserina]
MENFALPYLTSSATTGLLFAVLVFSYFIISRRSRAIRSSKLPPQVSGGWPLLGHLHLLDGSKQLPHITLGALTHEYGPIFTIDIGIHSAIVLNTWEAAKECFTTNDLVVSSRPATLSAKHLGYNYAMFGFGPYGQYCREIRKLVSLELLSNTRLDLLKHVRVSEVEMSLKQLYKHWSKRKDITTGHVSVEMKQWFGDFSLNVVLRMIAGKRYFNVADGDLSDEKEARRCQKAMRDFFHLVGLFVLGDAVPWLKWWDLGGQQKAMKHTAKELDLIVMVWLEEHKHRRTTSEKARTDQDFMDVMLSVLDGSDVAGFDADTVVKSTCLSLISGGTDTTTVTLTWALSLLLHNPQVLKKIHEELDNHVGKERNAARKRRPPEAAGAWPLVGHLPLLGGSLLPHISLGNMADKYGPLFTIKFGVHRSLIVSSWDIAKECLTTNDRVFANRPKLLISEVMGYNYAMFGFSPYGPYWRQMRKVATLNLLSNHRLESFKHVRESEVKAYIDNIYDLWKQDESSDHVLVDMKRWFGDVSLSIMFRIIVGKRLLHDASSELEKEENEKCRKAIREFFRLGGEFVLADAVPFLRWLDLGGHEKAMKKTANELDHVMERLLEEHKLKRSSTNCTSNSHDEPEDFMDMMLSILDDSILEFRGHTTAGTMNKATCLALILGGTDTTTATLTWALSLLVNNPATLKMAQNELDTQVGRNRQVNESDMKNLVYLQAIIKETMRLYPVVPLLAPHESTDDSTIGNYHIPTGTRLIVNIWKLHRDPNVWQDPCIFQPERFLTSHADVDVRGQNFELMPFGSGRRICPGISLALGLVELTLAHLLHKFEITAPSDEPVDMSETVGLTNMKATPLQVLLKPRII